MKLKKRAGFSLTLTSVLGLLGIASSIFGFTIPSWVFVVAQLFGGGGFLGNLFGDNDTSGDDTNVKQVENYSDKYGTDESDTTKSIIRPEGFSGGSVGAETGFDCDVNGLCHPHAPGSAEAGDQ